jgi:Flp pilus assembly protein TadD
MLPGDDALHALREAVRLSPENIPLRQHLADTLLSLGRPDEAEKEYRQALGRSADNERLKIGLGNAFYQQGKYSQALVLVEDLLKSPNTPARAYLLHARLLLQAGEVERAVRQYREAIELDPAIADKALAERLGIDADETSEVSEGRMRQSHEDSPAEIGESIERPNL